MILEFLKAPSWDLSYYNSLFSCVLYICRYDTCLMCKAKPVDYLNVLFEFNLKLLLSGLRSFGHQGALYYVFLAFDPLKTSREYAVFTLRTSGPKVCTRKTSRQTQRVSAFLFWLRQMIALLHTSRGKLAARTKFHNVLWKTKGFYSNIKNLVQKTKMGPCFGQNFSSQDANFPNVCSQDPPFFFFFFFFFF